MTRKNSIENEFKHLVSFTPTTKIPTEPWASVDAYSQVLKEWVAFKNYLSESVGKEGDEWIADSISTTHKFAVRFKCLDTAMRVKLAFNPR
jgi:hypothetical protein